MSLEANKALVRKFIDAYNQHDSDCVYTYLAPNYIARAFTQIIRWILCHIFYISLATRIDVFTSLNYLSLKLASLMPLLKW
jgi:hypothetical protein